MFLVTICCHWDRKYIVVYDIHNIFPIRSDVNVFQSGSDLHPFLLSCRLQGNSCIHRILYGFYQHYHIVGSHEKKRSTRKGENILWKVTLNSYFPLQAKGKIIVFDQQFVSYEVTVVYRDFGAYEASKVGGVASLIRSITPFSIDSPHTGWQYYKNGTAKIPTACITVEDAEMLSRMAARGDKIVLHLYMEAQNFSPAISRNTVAEIVGTTNPEEVGMYIPYWKNDKVEFKPTRILHVSYLIHIPTVLCKISRNQRDYICSAF